MSRWTGTLKKVDLGPGVWVLATEQGDLTLDGPVPDALEGERVVVEGRESAHVGFAMVGGVGIRVVRVTRA